MIIILWKNKNFPINIFFSNIVLTILRILVIIFHNESWWTKNAFYYSICLNVVDDKIKISIQCECIILGGLVQSVPSLCIPGLVSTIPCTPLIPGGPSQTEE